MFALLRRERDRAAIASPLVRARILESILGKFPDVSDGFPAPPCDKEMEQEGIDAIESAEVTDGAGRAQIRFDRELVAKVRAVHRQRPLLGLALRGEETISEYNKTSGETGPAPPRSFLQRLALSQVRYFNDDERGEMRRLLLPRLRAGSDATELLLLHDAAELILDASIYRRRKGAELADGPALLGAWISDLGRRLQGPPDRAALELVIVRLGDVGHYGVRLGQESAARGLGEELANLKYNPARCHVIQRLGEWLSDEEMAERFEAFVAPAFRGDRVVLDRESFCRLRVALRMKGAAESKRAALAARMLRTPLPGPGAVDRSLDASAITSPVHEDPVRQSAADALEQNPGWVDASNELRTWLEERALEPVPPGEASETWSLLEPAFEQVVDYHLSGKSGARPDLARTILRTWMAGGVIAQRMRALTDRAWQAGIADEVRATLDEQQHVEDAVVARYLLDLEAPAGR